MQYVEKRELLGQCADGNVLGEDEVRMAARVAFPHTGKSRAAVFEYVEFFYNRRRLHECNGYLTPEEYYSGKRAA